MKIEFTKRETWTLRAIYTIPILVLVAALLMAFQHAEKWHGRHSPEADAWEGWAFAIMIELPAIMGLLLLSVFPKIAPGKKPTIPRVLFASAAVISLVVQQAYAGSGASVSERITAGFPSVVAGVFVEIVFWVVGMVERARSGLLGVAATDSPAFVPPPPVLVSSPAAPMSPRTSPADVPGHVPPDIEPKRPMSPWTEPPPGKDMSPDTTSDISGDVPETRGVGHADIPQVTATVPPSHVPPTREGTKTGVLPAGLGDTNPSDPPDMSRDNEDTDGGTPNDQGDTDTDVHDPAEDQDTDTSADDTDTEGDKDIDPRAFEALSMRTKDGMSNPQIAAHFNVTTKTIGRWIKKALEAQQEPALAGSR